MEAITVHANHCTTYTTFRVESTSFLECVCIDYSPANDDFRS